MRKHARRIATPPSYGKDARAKRETVDRPDPQIQESQDSEFAASVDGTGAGITENNHLRHEGGTPEATRAGLS